MKNNKTVQPLLVLCITLGLIGATPPADARNIYLNGIDISNAFNQDLENVSIHINESGDIFVIAPHYQVNEEETFLPLSKLQARTIDQNGQQHTARIPIHKKPSPLPEGERTTDIKNTANSNNGASSKDLQPSSNASELEKQLQPKVEDKSN
ncbi:MAG: hypothetical protein R3B45_15050 [Bdellovibrionota bacterium]